MAPLEELMFAEQLPGSDIQDRINQRLQLWRGRPKTRSSIDQMKAEIMSLVFEAQHRGEISSEPEYEVVVEESSYGDQLEFLVREKAPPPPPRPVVKVPRGPSTPPNLDWERGMTPWEAKWCRQQIELRAKGLYCVDNYRAAQIWKSSQRRRFRKIEDLGCCGSDNWVERRWSISKGRWDYYLLGFNHGH